MSRMTMRTNISSPETLEIEIATEIEIEIATDIETETIEIVEIETEMVVTAVVVTLILIRAGSNKETEKEIPMHQSTPVTEQRQTQSQKMPFY